MLLGFGISGLKLWHKLPEHSIPFGPESYNILDEYETISENLKTELVAIIATKPCWKMRMY